MVATVTILPPPEHMLIVTVSSICTLCLKNSSEQSDQQYHQFMLLCVNKDTVPTREKDFVAHHFSHNAPHRPYIHCTHRGEGEANREQKKREGGKG